MIDMWKYQQAAKVTAIFPESRKFDYPIAELANEAGEVLGVLKKVWRDDNEEWTDEKRAKIKGELGDCLWAIALICDAFEWDMGEVAQENLDKLMSRMERGVLGGSGDNR